MTLDERLQKRKSELAETRARIQGYLSELDRMNQQALLIQGAINELEEQKAESEKPDEQTEPG